jgi:hypothetical protein
MFLSDGMTLLDGDREQLLHSTVPEIRTFISELQYKEEGGKYV